MNQIPDFAKVDFADTPTLVGKVHLHPGQRRKASQSSRSTASEIWPVSIS